MLAQQRKLLHYAEYCECAKTGDILLCRPTPRSIEGPAIVHVTRSQYCHASMLGWAYGRHGKKRRLRICETVGHRDAREIDAEAEIRRWPELYDVFRVDSKQFPKFDPETAWDFMQRAAGSGYGWRNIFRVWARRRLNPILRQIDCPILPIPNSKDPCVPRDCSALVQAAVRVARGPEWALFDCDVVPGRIAEEFTQYIGTLYHDRLLEAA